MDLLQRSQCKYLYHSLIHIRVLPDLLVCPDLPALLVADTMFLDTMSTEPISLP